MGVVTTSEHRPREGGAFCEVIAFEVPSDSPYDWLNHSIFLGTLTIPQLMPKDRPYVIIGVYRLL